MSSSDFVYASAITAINAGSLVWASADINAMLVSNLYAPSPVHDVYVSAIPPDAIIVRDYKLTAVGTRTDQTHYGTIPPFNSLSSPQVVRGVVLYVKGASDSVSQLIYYSSTGVGFPFQPFGFDYVVGFDQLYGGYFQQ